VALPLRRAEELIPPRLAIGIGGIVFDLQIRFGEGIVSLDKDGGDSQGFEVEESLGRGRGFLLQGQGVGEAGLRRYSVGFQR